MTKALFINGSPRRNANTAQLLQRAMAGARDAGAECEMVELYDRSLNYKGCMSCFACKVKGGRKGVCSFPDDLRPILERAVEADVLVCGTPVYCSYPTANLRAFMERLIFPAVNYSDFTHPVVNKPKRSATIVTMNCPDEEQYRNIRYDILMDTSGGSLGMFGPTETLYSFDTLQFNDYNRYDAAMLPADRKAERHRTQFPLDLDAAYALGRRLAENS
ncbi:MAG: flavodoxin family protein [Bacteroidales bacterium]|nr:flavodoxin family protein [Bacteroidales bacterium]